MCKRAGAMRANAWSMSTMANQDCQLYRDFRELLDRKDIDAVLIATGDRWHATASMMAAEAGKDVYSEKPCGLTIAYCQELADTMKRTGRIFQAGTQRRSVPNFQQAIELAHSGKLGKLHTLYASVYTPESTRRGCPANPRRRATSSIGISGSAPRRGGRTTPVCRRQVARILRLRFRRKAVGLGRTYRRPLPMGEPGRRHHADRV